jgi:4-hydroxy-tetrahydrodipicolinate reductase
MRIGLFGYGKMGQAIERIALQQGVEIAWRLRRDDLAGLTPGRLREADVAIEFTRPASAFENVSRCLEAGVPVVSGTTGWAARLPEARELCLRLGGALLWASNFSVGVNILFAVNRYLARLMEPRAEYEPDITEIHHIHKLDAPSGTAITLAQGIIEEVGRKNTWVLAPQTPEPTEIFITALREGEVPGTHRVRWAGAVDELALEHRAHSRDGFAAGALLAARWLPGRRGVYEMKDVLGL